MTDSLPDFDTARAEANAAIQEVVDSLPTKSPIEQLGEDSLGCDEAGVASDESGVTFTNHVAVVQADDFDGRTFIDELPSRLGSGYTARDTGLELNFPAVDVIASQHGDTLLSVTTGEDDGEKYVEIYAFSRCAQAPSTGSTSG